MWHALFAIALVYVLPHLPPAIIPTANGLLVTGSSDCIPLPPTPFAWETPAPNGNSTLKINRDGGVLTLHWRLDRMGPSWVCLDCQQGPRGVALSGFVESPERDGERVIERESYTDWEDLMRHSHSRRLANDLMMVLKRSGVEPCE